MRKRGDRVGPGHALKTGKCTQVVRGSYVSGNNKIMGTIGVINLSTTNEAHYAGKVVGQNDFIAPLTSAKGVASKLGNGTGIVEAEFKGHYLILTWSEFVNGTNPTTKAEENQLKQFSNDLVAEHREHRPQPAHGHRRGRHPRGVVLAGPVYASPVSRTRLVRAARAASSSGSG